MTLGNCLTSEGVFAYLLSETLFTSFGKEELNRGEEAGTFEGIVTPNFQLTVPLPAFQIG
jgi:hypothetical protein